jgi:predicted TPR repeat methyltransferase
VAAGLRGRDSAAVPARDTSPEAAPRAAPTTPGQALASVPARFEAAMQAHRAGRLEAAAEAYAHVLRRQPAHPDALHLLGLLHAQQGRLDDALQLITQAIAAAPREAMFHNNLGNVHLEAGRAEAAESAYRTALALDPGRLDAMNNLGVLLGRRRAFDEGEALLRAVVERGPDPADARQNLVNLLTRQGRLGDAVQVCQQGLLTAPRHPGLRRLLGAVYAAQGQLAQAAEVYRGWLQEDPADAVPRFLLQACEADLQARGSGPVEGGVQASAQRRAPVPGAGHHEPATDAPMPERAPDDFVQQVFDGFAASFDAKLAGLDYQAPQLVTDAVARHLGPGLGRLRVLDAGCGTGLCGPLLAPWAQRLVGVDLSAGMLAQAQRRAVYDALAQGELVAWLRDHAGAAAWDLVVCADTLCYFGALEAFAAAAVGALAPGGSLVCTLEAHPAAAGADAAPGAAPCAAPCAAPRDSAAAEVDPSAGRGRDILLHAHGRYSHSRPYAEHVLEGAGLKVCEITPVTLRQEAQRPVGGWLVVARAA